MRILDARAVPLYLTKIGEAFGDLVVESISITNAGIDGYEVGDQVIISGDGTGATAEVATVDEGQIQSITITNAGSGYTTATAVVQSENGSGAELSVEVSEFELVSELAAIDIDLTIQGYRLEQVLSQALLSLPLSESKAELIKAAIEEVLSEVE